MEALDLTVQRADVGRQAPDYLSTAPSPSGRLATANGSAQVSAWELRPRMVRTDGIPSGNLT
jgi:hypothetical protein